MLWNNEKISNYIILLLISLQNLRVNIFSFSFILRLSDYNYFIRFITDIKDASNSRSLL